MYTPSCASCPYLPSSSTHECHVCQLPVPSQLPVNKRDTCTVSTLPPEYCGDIVGEVVPSEGESVGGLEERRSGSHVGVLPLTVVDPACPAPSCLTYQLRGLAGYLSRPGPTSRAYLIPQGRLSSAATQRTTLLSEGRSDQGYCIIALGKHWLISGITFQLSNRDMLIAVHNAQVPPNLVAFQVCVYIHVMRRRLYRAARHIKIKRSIVFRLLKILEILLCVLFLQVKRMVHFMMYISYSALKGRTIRSHLTHIRVVRCQSIALTPALFKASWAEFIVLFPLRRLLLPEGGVHELLALLYKSNFQGYVQA